tara:strand:- start:316 stop:528 length:213 start_codon:yes stop_codon:yes gene_type:complete
MSDAAQESLFVDTLPDGVPTIDVDDTCLDAADHAVFIFDETDAHSDLSALTFSSRVAFAPTAELKASIAS